MPPQDTKWHKVSLSGKDTKWHNGTKWHNVCHLVSFCHVGNHGNSKNSIKAFFMLIKMVVKEIVVFGKIFRTIAVSMAIKS